MSYLEKNFESAIEEYLTTKGGYIKSTELGYDATKGYIPTDLIKFIKDSQAKRWEKIQKQYGSETESYFLKKVENAIDENGLLRTLRNDFIISGTKFKLIIFKPETRINEELYEQYNKNIWKCIRQLHYSTKNNNSIDTVLFINGFPIVTIELKNEYTGQTVQNAIDQYKTDRSPDEEIFKFNERSLVHFAVDLFEVYMTTKLSGEDTIFLPFNQGSNGAGNVGGKGNPNNTEDFGTAYLWKNVLCKDRLMEILSKYMHLEYDKKQSFKTGKMIFPRYHQLDVVTKLIEDTKNTGSGKNYLIEHSAGSGKSNSIAWLSYRLASLHDNNDNKIFDSIIVVTDRKVLDDQLQDTIGQFEHVSGLVEKIDKNKSSEDLLNAINDGKKIIITTLQKFPVIYNKINSTNKKFAIIVDEAHSSQTGSAAAKLKEGLGNTEEILEEYAREENEQENNSIDDEDKLLNELAAQGRHLNMSFYAFTATPKEKTLQLFGTKMEDGSYKPFHIYSMKQAIEEGFILDVLQNYMTYNMYYKIVKSSSENPEIKLSKGMRQIASYESLHPHNISQKAAIMIEQFMNTTSKKIGGNAKAMVVTASRLHAVRYVKEFRRYIKEHKLEDNIKVLVAFSGEINDEGETLTETKLNVDKNGKHIKENTLPKYFNSDFNVLIVAEKYQTGFDEPLLHTMFVDKKLSGVKAVQTLSRLNRTCKGKNDTFILDFVNSVDDIQKSFQPYYEGTILNQGVDPNNVYDICNRVEAYKLFDFTQAKNFAESYYSNEQNMGKLNGYLYPSIQKYNSLEEEDKKNFKSTLQAFLRAYSFIAQVSRMMDKDIQMKYIFCKYLNTVLPKEYTKNIDLVDKIDLQYYKLEKKFEGKIELTEEEGRLNPPKGTIGKKEEEEATLDEIVNKINNRYGTEFTNMDKVFEQLALDFVDDEQMVNYANNNNEDAFRKVYTDEFPKKAIKRYQQNNELFDTLMSKDGAMDEVMDSLFSIVYKKLKEKAKQELEEEQKKSKVAEDNTIYNLNNNKG